MTFRKIILLAIVVGVLSLIVFQVEMPRIEQERKGKLFLGGVDSSELTKVEVIRPNDRFVLTKKNSEAKKTELGGYSNQLEWQLADNGDALLDYGSVDGLVNALTELEFNDPIPENDIEGDWGVYGLKEPFVSVQVSWQGDKSATIDLGKKSEYLGERFARVKESGKLYLIPDALFLAANKGSDELRDKTPIDVNSDEIDQVIIDINKKGGAEKLISPIQTKLQKSDQQWNIVSAGDVKADESALSEFVRKLRSLEVLGYNDSGNLNSDSYDFNLPDIKISFIKGNESYVVELTAGTKENTFFRLPGVSKTVYEVAGSKIGDFLLERSQLLDRQVFQFDVSKVEKAEIKINDEVIALEGQSEGEKSWKINGSAGDGVIIEGLLDNISNLKVDDLVDETTAQDFNTLLTFKITLKDQKLIEFEVSDSINDSSGGFHLVRRKDWKGIYKISEDTYSSLVPNKEALVKVNDKNPS